MLQVGEDVLAFVAQGKFDYGNSRSHLSLYKPLLYTRHYQRVCMCIILNAKTKVYFEDDTNTMGNNYDTKVIDLTLLRV